MPNSILPLFDPGAKVTYTASATLTAGQLVELTGDRLVGPAGAASVKVIGVAMRDTASGAQVPVWGNGIMPLTASVTLAAGDTVVAAAAGAAGLAGATPDARTVVGRVVTGATATNTAYVQLLLG